MFWDCKKLYFEILLESVTYCVVKTYETHNGYHISFGHRIFYKDFLPTMNHSKVVNAILTSLLHLQVRTQTIGSFIKKKLYFTIKK